MNDERLTDEALARLAAAIEPYGGYDGKVTLTVSDVTALLAEVERLRTALLQADRQWNALREWINAVEWDGESSETYQAVLGQMDALDMQQSTLNAAAPSQHNTIQP
jgi:hypothetical protein